jgi:hypothetical protein
MIYSVEKTFSDFSMGSGPFLVLSLLVLICPVVAPCSGEPGFRGSKIVRSMLQFHWVVVEVPEPAIASAVYDAADVPGLMIVIDSGLQSRACAEPLAAERAAMTLPFKQGHVIAKCKSVPMTEGLGSLEHRFGRRTCTHRAKGGVFSQPFQGRVADVASTILFGHRLANVATGLLISGFGGEIALGLFPLRPYPNSKSSRSTRS